MTDIPPVWFLFALLGAPFVPVLFTLPLAVLGPFGMITAFFGIAIYFGAATYLLFRSAAFIAAFRYERGSGFWLYAILGHIASLPFAAMVFRLYKLRLDFTAFALLGVLVSPIWGGCFGWLTVLADGRNHALQPEASARQH